MIPNFARKQLLSLLWIKQGIVPCSIASTTVDTYDASPQPAGGIDSWDGGALRPRNLLLVIDVASLNAGHIDVMLYDSPVAITTANGATVCHKVADLTAITEAGLYVAEFQMDQEIFPDTSARVVAHDEACEIMRYLDVKVTTTGGTAVMSVLCIFGRTLKGFPVQDATNLAITFNES